MSLSKTCKKKADEEETKHEENDGKKCEKEAEDVPSKSVKSSTRKRTTKKSDDGASTSQQQQRRKPSRKNPQGVGGGNLSKFLCTVDSDVKLNGNDNNNNNAETDKPADDDQKQTNDRGAEEGEDAEPSSTTSKPKKIKYVFNSFETGAQCSNNYCNPSSCAYGSDDENVILKLNITNPPAPMGAYATNTASFAARVDDNACSNEGPCAGLTHRDEFLERPLCMFPSEHSLGTDDSNPFKDYYCPGAGGAGDPSRGDVVPQGVMGSTEDGAGRHGWVGMCRQPHVVEQSPSGGRSIRLLAEFEEKNKSGEWPANTSVHCYWCCHPFNGPPVGIPAKFVRNKFYLYGCFCSLECAAAYNFHHNGSIDERWRRYSLINLMASKMGHKGGVKQAPDRLTLNIFGGHLNIEAFRSYCKSHHNLTLVNFPPMQAMTQQVEEVNEGDVRCMRPSYIPLDHGRANRAQAKLVLKRNKPLVTGKNTLDRAINLEIQRQPDI